MVGLRWVKGFIQWQFKPSIRKQEYHPEIIEVKVETEVNIPTGMTTSSRATALVANAIIDASKRIRKI